MTVGYFISMPLILEIVGCGKNEYGSSSTLSDTDGFQVTFSSAGVHTHSVRILLADLTNPPAAGGTYASSSAGHTHTIYLTQQQLTAINGGSAITVVSSVDSGHSHDWMITKP